MMTDCPGRGANCGCMPAHAACSDSAALYSRSRDAISRVDLLSATDALSSSASACFCVQGRDPFVMSIFAI